MANNSITLTVTGVLGPGLAITSQVFGGVKAVEFLVDQGIIRITKSNGVPFDIAYVPPTATITYTISGAVGTVAIS